MPWFDFCVTYSSVCVSGTRTWEDILALKSGTCGTISVIWPILLHNCSVSLVSKELFLWWKTNQTNSAIELQQHTRVNVFLNNDYLPNYYSSNYYQSTCTKQKINIAIHVLIQFVLCDRETQLSILNGVKLRYVIVVLDWAPVPP